MSGHHNLEGKNGQIALKMLDDIRSVLDKHKIVKGDKIMKNNGDRLNKNRENKY